MTPQERIAELEAENARLREQMTALLARVQELEARLTTECHDGGKPPSSDGLARKTRSLRRQSGKKPGGRVGHRGRDAASGGDARRRCVQAQASNLARSRLIPLSTASRCSAR